MFLDSSEQRFRATTVVPPHITINPVLSIRYIIGIKNVQKIARLKLARNIFHVLHVYLLHSSRLLPAVRLEYASQYTVLPLISLSIKDRHVTSRHRHARTHGREKQLFGKFALTHSTTFISTQTPVHSKIKMAHLNSTVMVAPAEITSSSIVSSMVRLVLLLLLR